MVLAMLQEQVNLDTIVKISGWTLDAVRHFAEKNKIQLA